GDRPRRFRVVRLAVVAADDHAVVAIPEGDREHAGRLDPGEKWRLADTPGLPPVARAEHARRLGPAGAEPDVVLAAGDEAGAAGREGPLLRQGRGPTLLRQRGPLRAAVAGDEQSEPTV